MEGTCDYYDPTEENEADRSKTRDGCIPVTDRTTELKGGEWYVVNKDVTINGRITVSGEVNLILADETTLTANEGIHLTAGNSITIWGETKGGNGKLDAENDTLNDAGIGGNAGESWNDKPGEGGENAGELTINGGNVTTRSCESAGIGGGKGGDSSSENGRNGGNGGVVTINSGIVIAESQHGAGIGGGNGGNKGSNNGVDGSPCDLTIADGMCIYTPKDGSEPVPANEREGGCRKNSVKITECTDHSEFFCINNGDGTHSISCKWCATKTTEKHTYADGICPCGAYIPPTVSNVTATASSPWDGTVSIDFTLSGYMPGRQSAWNQYVLSVTATDNKTNKTYTANASTLSGDTDAAEGTHSIVWDLKAQGIEFTSSSVAFTVEYLYLPDYCVIDLSGGPEADTYPVTYLCAEPEGGWSDEYKTNKYVMRLIEPGTFEKGRDLISLSVNGMKAGLKEKSQKFEFTAEILDASVGETLIWKSNAPNFAQIATVIDGTTSTVRYAKAAEIGDLEPGVFYEMYAETPDGIRSNPVHFGIFGKDPIIYFKTPQDNIVVKVNEPLDFQVFFYAGEGQSGTPSIKTQGTGWSRSFISGVKIGENESVSWTEPGNKYVIIYFEKNGKKTERTLYVTVIDADVPQEIAVTQPFYSAVFETTQKQWNLVTGSNPSLYKGETRPVERVSWNTIREASFLGVLQEKTGLAALDLPTSEQWEYACRAGSTMEYGYFDDGLRHYDNRNDGRGGYDTHTVVGSYEPNAWGLFDMRGNVWEWCLEQKVCGGGWDDWNGNYRGSENENDLLNTCVPSYQIEHSPGWRDSGVGFRLVQSLSAENRLVCSGTSNSISVGKKPASITVDPDQGKVYGEDDPTLTATVQGLEGNEKLNYKISRSVGESVGTYDIKVTLGENPNYEITVTEDKFTITRKPASITVDPNQSKIYGEKDPDIFSATVEGTVGTDKLNYSLSRTGGENVGEYPITITLGDNPNYEVTATDGKLTITPKSASITVDVGQGKTYGEEDPALIVTVEGAVGSETLSYELFREKGEDAGDYTISVKEGDNPNYAVTTTSGTFTVSPLSGVTVTVTGKNNTSVYDSEEHIVTGYNAEASSPLYNTENDFAFDGKAEASRTEVGTTSMGLTADQFRNVNKNFSDVTFSVTDGYQTIAEADKSELNQIIEDSEKYRDLIDDKYPEIAEILDEEIDKAKAVEKDPNVTEEEVKAAANALEKALGEAKNLAADKNEFEKFQTKAVSEIRNLLETGDSIECANLINRAANEIRSLPYDEEKTLDENIEEILDIVSNLEKALAAQRKREYEYAKSIEAALRKGRELQEKLKAEEEAARKDALPFTDVPTEFEPIVRFVYGNGIMNGTSDTLLTPYGTLTRGMIVTILYRMEGEPTTTYTATFSDVPAGEWYTPGVEWAAANKIVLGFGDNTYGPSKPVTREQLAAILYRYAEFKGYPTSIPNTMDLGGENVSPWATEYMAWALSNQILLPDETGSARGTSPALRWEVAAAVREFLT